MLTKFKVENFKSINSLELELGRVNVFIGENGSGKSNVLEAVALASAALQDRLDHEFLAPRGIRVTAPELMRSGFDKKSESNHVFLRPWVDGLGPIPLTLAHTNQRYAQLFGFCDHAVFHGDPVGAGQCFEHDGVVGGLNI